MRRATISYSSRLCCPQTVLPNAARFYPIQGQYSTQCCPIQPAEKALYPYQRSGRTNQRLSHEEAFQLYANSRGITWDSTILNETSIRDVDRQAVRHFLQTARDERRWDVSPNTPANQVLSQLGLLPDGKLNVAGYLLFGRNPQRLFSQATLRCARFKGTNEW